MKHWWKTLALVWCVVIIVRSWDSKISAAPEAGHQVGKQERNFKPFTGALRSELGIAEVATKVRDLSRRLTPASSGLEVEEIPSNDKPNSQVSPRGRRRTQQPHWRSPAGQRAQEVAGVADASRRREMQEKAENSSCPLDFRGMREFPWFVESCEDHFTPENSSNCCTALLYALGQAEAQHLRSTGEFRVKDTATVAACMDDLAGELSVEGLSNSNVVPTCFPPSDYFHYVSDPSQCQGIITRSDFERVVGASEIASLDSACSGSLADIPTCGNCVDVMKSVITELNSISPNFSDCSVFTLIYGGGVSNSEGPYSPGTAHCVFSVTVIAPVEAAGAVLARDIGIGAAAAFLAFSIAAVFFCAWWRRRKGAIHRAFIERNTTKLKSSMRPNTGLIQYAFDELKAATRNFSGKNFIGSGGFGEVYKGVLEDGLEVAVKRMKNCSEEQDAEFVNEVDVINSVRHRNLVVLRGCCVASTPSEGHQRLLVYDYMPNGSLYDYLFGKGKPVLTWLERRKLAIDMAKGIAYLHNATRPPIIHRDIKSANILLDENLNARVADFGLAKFTIEGQTHVSATNVAGTMGYVAPEYVLYNQITEKSDVYSFGVVLLELLSGNRALEGSNDQPPNSGFILITDWARAKAKEGTLLDIVDERIRDEGQPDVMEKFVHMAMLCCHQLVLCRPSMEEVLHILEGEIAMPGTPTGVTVSQQLDINYLLHSGFSSYEWYSGTSSTRSTTNLSVSEFSGRSADISPSELLR